MTYEVQQLPNSQVEQRVKWTRQLGGSMAVFTRKYPNGEVWTMRVDETGFVTQQQAAQLLGVALVRVNEWARYDRIPSRNIGGQSMIPLKAVRAIYEKRKRDGMI